MSEGRAGRTAKRLPAITKFQERSRMYVLPARELETTNFQSGQLRIEHILQPVVGDPAASLSRHANSLQGALVLKDFHAWLNAALQVHVGDAMS